MEKLLHLMSIISVWIGIIYCLKALRTIENQMFCYIARVLLGMIALRYIAVILFSFSYQVELLKVMRYFYFGSSIGLTLLMALAIWYVIPFIREKKDIKTYILYYLPWILWNSFLSIKQPTSIIPCKDFGYKLVICAPYQQYFGAVQAGYIVVVTLLCIMGIKVYKHLQIRVQLSLLMIAQVLWVIDGISYSTVHLQCFRAFTVTEAFALWVIYYAFTHVLQLKSKKY